MRRWRTTTTLFGALVLVLSMLGIASAQQSAIAVASAPGDPCDTPAGDSNPNCDEDGDFDPPCDEADEKDDPECQEEQPEEPEEPQEPGEGACTDEDTDGLGGNTVASGVIAQISDEAAANGAPAELTDGIDTLNCEVVVTIEQAIEGQGGGEPPAPPAPPAPPELPELPAPGAPGELPLPPAPASCGDVVEGLADGGAPAELTGPLGEACAALDGGLPPIG